MDSFTIKGGADFITMTFEEVFGFPNETCHWGGYDLRTTLEIKSRGFYLKSTLYTSTGEIFEFFQQLKNCNDKLTGTAYFKSYEGNLEINAHYDNAGHVNVEGKFSEQNEFGNKLQFEFNSDQTFIRYTIDELQIIADKYGDMKGIKQ